MEKSVFINNLILALSAPGPVNLAVLREPSFCRNLIEHSLDDFEARQQKVVFDIESDCEEYLSKVDDDKFTAILEKKLNQNYPS
jgi:hypothetical protein